MKAMMFSRIRAAVLALALTTVVVGGSWLGLRTQAGEQPGVARKDQTFAEPPRSPQGRPSAVAGAQTQQGNVSQKAGYLAFSVRTELQRHFLQMDGGQVGAFMFINGATLLSAGGKVNAEALDLDGVRKALVAQRGKDKHSRVVFDLICTTSRGKEAGMRLIVCALKQVGREAGFDHADVGFTFSGERSQWGDLTREGQRGAVDKGNSEETGVGDELVKVFPVRTRLSRCLSGGADCVAVIRPPLDERFPGQLKPETEKRIRAGIKKLGTLGKGTILFDVRVAKGGHRGLAVFENSAATELATKLGFAHGRVRSTLLSQEP